jgi:hypothetical protein
VLIAEYVMIVHDNEVLGPEHLAELGALFDKTWAAFQSSANSESYTEARAQLACILLRLYGLRQLGPDQVTQTALRLLKRSPSVLKSAGVSMSAGQPEPVDVPTSSSCPALGAR